MKIIFYAALILFVSSYCYAADANNVVEKEVVGKGPDKNQAIKYALYTAVSQVRGMKVDSGDVEFGYMGAAADINSVQAGTKKIEFDAVSVAASGTSYKTKTSGLVKSYEILEENKLDDGSYMVKLKVMVYDIAAKLQSKRLKIAVFPTKTLAQVYYFCGREFGPRIISDLMSQRLAVGLTESNKFAVLDRESIAELVHEKMILLSDDAPLEEKAKLAETLGADLMLVTTISEAKIDRIQKVLSAANYTTYEYKARVVLNYRLVDSATRQIVHAGILEKFLENDQIRALSNEPETSQWDVVQLRDALFSIVANDAVAEIVDKLYPIKIAAVQRDGSVILEQGGSKLAAGSLLEVFTEGDEITDSDTKESLGKVQTKVAVIKVEQLQPNIAIAKLVDGDISKLSKGLTCRITKTVKKENPGMKSDVKITPQGGVKMPFDK